MRTTSVAALLIHRHKRIQELEARLCEAEERNAHYENFDGTVTDLGAALARLREAETFLRDARAHDQEHHEQVEAQAARVAELEQEVEQLRSAALQWRQFDNEHLEDIVVLKQENERLRTERGEE